MLIITSQTKTKKCQSSLVNNFLKNGVFKAFMVNSVCRKKSLQNCTVISCRRDGTRCTVVYTQQDKTKSFSIFEFGLGAYLVSLSRNTQVITYDD